MTDTRKLLERCAKVMNLPSFGMLADGSEGSYEERPGEWTFWNPLTNLADAADMSVKMKVDVLWADAGNGQGMSVTTFKGARHRKTEYVKDHPTEQAAYCYAVCSVVAQMGEMK